MAILNKTEAKQCVETWKESGLKVVFTNGCFDLLHRGHVEILMEAKSLGDRLIIGVNSDDSVRRLKGPGRPVQTVQDRMVILDALTVVDNVVCFDEDTPLELIQILKPSVLVKGGDYTSQEVVGAHEVRSWNGYVRVLPYRKGFSTSGLIGKVRDLPEAKSLD